MAHQLQTDHPELKSVTYGAPSISWGTKGGENRFRNAWDPVSMFDRGAVQRHHPNPLHYAGLTHDFHNSPNVSAQPSADPTKADVEGKEANPDGSVSISE